MRLEQPRDLAFRAQAFRLHVALQPLCGDIFEAVFVGRVFERGQSGAHALDDRDALACGVVDVELVGLADGRPDLLPAGLRVTAAKLFTPVV